MNVRIKEIRISENLSQEEFGNIIKISKSGVSALETGKNKASDQTISLICKEFSVNEHWLRTGEGDMFSQSEIDRIIMKYAKQLISESDPNSAIKRKILVTMAKLTPEQWEIVTRMIKEMAEEA